VTVEVSPQRVRCKILTLMLQLRNWGEAASRSDLTPLVPLQHQ
jgi:hypothetical protein